MGINYEEVKAYWDKRAKEQGVLTVGHRGADKHQQDREYEEKIRFISALIDTDISLLDYGCGIGRLSRIFPHNKYLGVDISEDLVKIAKLNNQDYTYKVLGSPEITTDITFSPDAILFATVLQHNSDVGVMRILRSIDDVYGTGFALYVYENSSSCNDTNHMRFRSSDDYLSLIRCVYPYATRTVAESHITHGEEHTLSVFHV